MSFDNNPNALASALPDGITFDFPQGDQWGPHEIAELQAERLAESGYVLLHGELVDDETVRRMAWGIAAHTRLCSCCPTIDNPEQVARAALAGLVAAPRADEHAGVDRG